jgi:hypothetical protein
VPDIVAGTFEKLMEFVYKGEAKLWLMDIESAIGLYCAGLLEITQENTEYFCF